MSDFNFNFDFDSLVNSTSNDPFNDQKKSYESDTRFYTLSKDADGNGQALIMFLPDADKKIVQKVFKFNITNNVNGKRRFINMFSPMNAGLPDPLQEEWARLWNSGDREAARKFSRSVRYVTNIKIIKDPANPENEGKIFLYELSKRLFEKLKQALCPSAEEIALGSERKEIFNPFKGYVFKLVCRGGQANGIPSYDSSEFIHKPELQVYKTPEEAVNDITKNSHKLSWFLDPANYPSYDEILDKKAWLLGEKTASVKTDSELTTDVRETNNTATEVQDSDTAQVKQPRETTKDDIDALIADIHI